MSEQKIWVVVPAAGQGTRMAADRPKQYLTLAGRSILHHTLARLAQLEQVEGIFIGLHKDDKWWDQDPWQHTKLMPICCGGETRMHTTINILNELLNQACADDWVLVHDAVRPCFLVQDVVHLIKTVQAGEVGGLLALKLADTLKKADGSGQVEQTLDRNHLWRAMTPQMFKAGQLLEALQQSLSAGLIATDESAAMERLGVKPYLVACDASNIKITVPADLILAGQILAILQ